MAKPIYLDWNATTPLCKRAKESMRPFLEQDDLFGNPSSAHVLGEEPRRRLETARGQLARAVNAREGTDIIFTGCGSESNALAIEQAIMGMSASKPHVVTTSIEHPAILESLKYYESIGRLEASYVDASEEGVVDPIDIRAAIRPTTSLVTVMHANNETGALQPVERIAEEAKSAGVLYVHTDASQTLGKIPVDVQALGVDMATFAAHKLGGPKGIGALFMMRGKRSEGKVVHGGSQEMGLRAGTESVMLAAGFGAAAESATESVEGTQRKQREAKEALWSALVGSVGEGSIRLNGPKGTNGVLPNTINAAIPGLDAQRAVEALREKVAMSAGAACHSQDGAAKSHVLEAMHIDERLRSASLRLSVGPGTTVEEATEAGALIAEEARRQRGASL